MRIKADLNFSRAAFVDLKEIDAYVTREFGRRRAKLALQRLRSRIEGLRDQPLMGRLIASDERGRRMITWRPNLIIYEVRNSEARPLVLVLRIVHGARDLATILGESP